MAKTVSKVIFVVAVVAAIGGIGKINDNLSKRVEVCDPLFSVYLESGERCVQDALSAHNEAVNQGWGITIASGIVGFVSGMIVLLDEDNINNNTKKNTKTPTRRQVL